MQLQISNQRWKKEKNNMSAEDRPGVPGQQPEQRNLVVRSGGSNLENSASRPLLARVGLPPKFMQHLGELNDALTQRVESRIREFGIQFVAGQDPVVNTQIEYAAAPTVSVRTFPGIDVPNVTGETEIVLQAPRNQEQRYALLYKFTDLAEFTRTGFPDRKATLHAEPNFDSIEPAETLDVDLYTVTDDALIELKHRRRMKVARNEQITTINIQPYSSFEIALEGIRHPLFTFELPGMEGVDWKAAFCDIREFYFRGRNQLADNVLQSLTELMAKPDESPFALPYPKDQSEVYRMRRGE
jgi:hypothetical protein